MSSRVGVREPRGCESGPTQACSITKQRLPFFPSLPLPLPQLEYAHCEKRSEIRQVVIHLTLRNPGSLLLGLNYGEVEEEGLESFLMRSPALYRPKGIPGSHSSPDTRSEQLKFTCLGLVSVPGRNHSAQERG